MPDCHVPVSLHGFDGRELTVVLMLSSGFLLLAWTVLFFPCVRSPWGQWESGRDTKLMVFVPGGNPAASAFPSRAITARCQAPPEDFARDRAVVINPPGNSFDDVFDGSRSAVDMFPWISCVLQ